MNMIVFKLLAAMPLEASRALKVGEGKVDLRVKKYFGGRGVKTPSPKIA